MIEVVHLQRYPLAANHSVERIFEDVRAHAPRDISFKLIVNRHPSTGVLNRLRDAWRARSVTGDIRHILGDTHYLGWFLPRERTVLTVLDCVSLERMSGWKRAIFKMLWYTLPLWRAEKVTTISDFSRRSLESWTGYPADKVTIIPPTLSDEFQPMPMPSKGERAVVLQVGTNENKNVGRTIEALAGLDVELIVVGRLQNEHRELLEQQGVPFEELERIGRAELVEQYHRSHIVLFASLYEGFGMPVIEAQAIGRPVITSNRCAMPEAAGGAAILVDPEDVSEIRSAVVRLLQEPALARSLVEAGFVNAERFRPAVVVHQYCELYRELASASGASCNARG